MEDIFNYILNSNTDILLLSIWAVVFATSIALIPGHNDVLLAFLLVNLPVLEITVYEMFFIYFSAIILADTLIYFIGHRFGTKVFKWKFIKQKISEDSVNEITNLLNNNVFKVLLLQRISPFFRPQIMLITTSFKIKAKEFFTNYLIILSIFLILQFYLMTLINEFILTYFEEYKLLGIILCAFVWIMMALYLKKSILKKAK